MREHWFCNGPLTEEIIDLLIEEEAGMGGVLIANEYGVYVAPHGAIPGDREVYFHDVDWTFIFM